MKAYLKFSLGLMAFLMLLGFNLKPDTITQDRTKIEMITNYGTMVIELYNETPLHRDNFIKLINEKKYDSLLFHRVIESFMIQGGDPESRYADSEAILGGGDLNYRVQAEFNQHFFHKKGALSTAREETLNRVSSAMQFFIVQGKVYNDSLLEIAESRINKMLARHHVLNKSVNKPLWLALKNAEESANEKHYFILNDSIDALADKHDDFEKYHIPQSHRAIYKAIGGAPHLDQNYTVFGQVIEGLNVVDSIAIVKTDKFNRPIRDVRIISVRLIN